MLLCMNLIQLARAEQYQERTANKKSEAEESVMLMLNICLITVTFCSSDLQ